MTMERVCGSMSVLRGNGSSICMGYLRRRQTKKGKKTCHGQTTQWRTGRERVYQWERNSLDEAQNTLDQGRRLKLRLRCCIVYHIAVTMSSCWMDPGTRI